VHPEGCSVEVWFSLPAVVWALDASHPKAVVVVEVAYCLAPTVFLLLQWQEDLTFPHHRQQQV